MSPRQDPLKRLRERPHEVIDLIPPARTAEQREKEQARKAWKNKWDTTHPVTVFYIPDHLQEQAKDIHACIKRLADEYVTTTGDLSHALASYALAMVRADKLHVDAQLTPKRARMTVLWEPVQPDERKPKVIPQRVKKVLKPDPLRIGYRWPSRDVTTQLKAIANSLATTPGEVLIFLLDYSIQAYERGEVRLAAAPVEARQQVNADWK